MGVLHCNVTDTLNSLRSEGGADSHRGATGYFVGHDGRHLVARTVGTSRGWGSMWHSN